MKFFFKFFSIIFIFISFILLIDNFKLIESFGCETDEDSVEQAAKDYDNQYNNDEIEGDSEESGETANAWLDNVDPN